MDEGLPLNPLLLFGRSSALALAHALRLHHPDPIYEDGDGLYLLRFPCTVCSACTIPIRPAQNGAPWHARGLPSAYPCPVCGMLTQYPRSWSPTVSERLAEGRQLLAERGYVTLAYGPLRAPWESELPEPDGADRPWPERIRRVRFPDGG